MESNDLERRILGLERELSRAKAIVRVGMVVLLVLTLGSLTRPADDTLRLRRLEIVDEQGRPRIVAEASPDPKLLFKSESEQNLIRLAIGGAEDWFPFDAKGVPHMTLETGQTQIRLSASPVPDRATPDAPWAVESAQVAIQSLEKGAGKLVMLIVDPSRAQFAVNTLRPDDPTSIFVPSLRMLVDREGKVETTLPTSEESRDR